jgi:hypothetical protein
VLTFMTLAAAKQCTGRSVFGDSAIPLLRKRNCPPFGFPIPLGIDVLAHVQLDRNFRYFVFLPDYVGELMSKHRWAWKTQIAPGVEPKHNFLDAGPLPQSPLTKFLRLNLRIIRKSDQRVTVNGTSNAT